MNTCPGCAKNFEHTGYAHHLAQTINPSYATQLQLSEFTGDYFGYYDEQDLEWPDDNHDEPPLESDEEEEDHDAALEHGGDDLENSNDSQPHPAERQEAEVPLGHQPIIEKFPWRHAAFESYKNALQGAENLRDALGLSYQNTRELNQIIDQQLPCRRPRFKHEEIIVADEAFDVYSRDIMECVKALYSDPKFSQHLNYAPERHYADADKTIRLYHDIHTGKKNSKQRKPGVTVIPIILSSDKTQVTMFRNKYAYPVYMTIGNIPKEILPGEDGVAMASGDGVVRRGHPIVACYSADYPEQLLTTGIKSGECPKCDIPHTELGSPHFPVNLRDLNAILAALSLIDEDYDLWRRACQDCGIKPIFKPFWLDLPHTNIFQSITPDDKRGHTIPARFDTVLVNRGNGGIMGMNGVFVFV
ncbi:hypothetical protein DFJ58DRAFT_876866 [Suillus subalutaceus]|uniref:uncharacterized protein n=1 Tax=Suillus subalutaceus TaxID=48586 RepID=UPI001B87DC7D|nr:uncharacterized protein DFJ58DRAFT_876866 [Suillus subalutaceus]KAG1828745.1 hypothetical protein DFJ58DRAFT_876866 [Suillus subalutaceus]